MNQPNLHFGNNCKSMRLCSKSKTVSLRQLHCKVLCVFLSSDNRRLFEEATYHDNGKLNGIRGTTRSQSTIFTGRYESE